MNKKLLVSSAPFKSSGKFVYLSSLLWIVALLPALIMGFVFSGEYSILTFCLAFGSYVTLDIFYIIATKQPFYINILKTIPTAIIIGMILPPNIPVFVPIMCSVISFTIKVFFGDNNGMIVNKSVIGVIIMITILGIADFNAGLLGVTPSAFLRAETVPNIPLLNLFLGIDVAGFVGTTCICAIMIGGLLLCFTRNVNFRVPLLAILTFSGVIFAVRGVDFVLPELMSGAVLFMFLFVATEYYTCPNNGLSGYVYGIILGGMTAIFKLYFPDLGEYVAFYALLICNLFVAIIDTWRPKYFGEEKKNAKISI